MVEAAAQRLAVQRDDPPPRRGGAPEMLGVAAEGGLEVGRVERVEEGAQRVDGGGATKAGTEDRVEPLARHADEQADAAVGGGAGQDGQHREQQQGSEAVTPALAAARVRDLLQGGEQAGERHHGGLRCGGRSALNGPGAPPVPRPPAPPSQTAHLQNRIALGCIRVPDLPIWHGQPLSRWPAPGGFPSFGSEPDSTQQTGSLRTADCLLLVYRWPSVFLLVTADRRHAVR